MVLLLNDEGSTTERIQYTLSIARAESGFAMEHSKLNFSTIKFATMRLYVPLSKHSQRRRWRVQHA